MENYTLDEAAAYLPGHSAESLQKKILFSGKAHSILKPCVFFPEPTSMRLAHRNPDRYVKESGIEHTMKLSNAFKYQVMLRGLFEMTFYPEQMDMTETRESGRIQLYRAKAVCAPLANAAVNCVMNNWRGLSRETISRESGRIRQEVGDLVILTQGDLHYLVDSPVSIPLSDIRITDRMLTEYAASEGITIVKDRAKIPEKEWFTLQETAALLERTGPNGQLLTGYEAEQAVLRLVFEESDGERFPLIPAVRFDSQILIKRYLSRLDRDSEGLASLDYGAKIKGYWPCAGFPRKRFRYVVPPPPYCVHPFQVTTAPENPVEFIGLLHLWLYGQPRRVDWKIILDKSGIDPKAAFPHSGILWYDPAFHEYPTVEVMAFEKVVVEGIEHRTTCKTINENELVITRRSLTRYAADHGYINTLRLLADAEQAEKPVNAPPVTSFLNPAPDPCHLVTKALEQLTVPLAPAAEVEEVKQPKKRTSTKGKSKPRLDRKRFWTAVEKWVASRFRSGKPGITDFRAIARQDPSRFDLDGTIDDYPTIGVDGKYYYCLATGVEVPESTVENRLKEFYEKELIKRGKVTK